MTSLISSSLNTIPNEALLPTVKDSSPTASSSSSSNVTNIIRVLSSWVNTRLGKLTIEHFDKDFRDGACFNHLLTRLHIDNNSSTHQDHLSDVARIIDALMEDDKDTTTNRLSSSTVDEVEYSIRMGHVDVTLELVSCIILKLSMKSILVDQHTTTWINQMSCPHALQTQLSALPTFQIGDLTFQHTFLDVRSTLMAWVNWQFKNGFGDLDFDPVLDFGPSWKNGLAFTLLIHCQNDAFLPDDLRIWLQQIVQLGNDHNKWIFIDDRSQTCTLLSLVFDIARRHMDIPTYFDPQGLLDMDSVNEWCVIIYVYEFYLYSLSSASHSLQPSTVQFDLQHALISVQSVSHTINNDGTLEPLCPLDNIDDDKVALYSQKVSKTLSLWELCLMEKVDLAQHSYQQLEESVDAMTQGYNLFKLGISFVKISQAIQTELQTVETMMNNTDSTMTTDSIQQLESRMSMVQSSLSGMEEEFNVLVKQHRYSSHLNQLHERYKLVCAWVDQVRIWMIEADRIRGRIGYWIDLIRERNALVDDLQLNALTVVDLTSLDHLDVMTLYNEHEQLKREVDRFEADDMKRLRAHVKQRTTDQDTHRDDLTPADTSTIEITLITLNMLHLLLQLMTDRGQWIDCLVQRLKWEHLFEKAVEWIFAKDSEFDQFFREQALWCEQDDDGFNLSRTTGMAQSGVSPLGTTDDGKETAEQIIGVLIRLEQDIAAFDRESFTDVLDAYQEMEGLVADGDALPTFLEQRQTGFESAFEDLMKRCGLGRKAVEQHLVMMDIIAQFKNIKSNGELLRRRLLVGNDGFGDDDINGKIALDNYDDDGIDSYGNDSGKNGNPIDTCVRNFKETSADFLAHAKTRIPYPDVPQMLTAMGAHDSQDINATNDAIRSALHTYGMSLALIADGLDQLLAERQHMHSLQRRVKHACEQLARFADWMTDKRRMIDKSDFDLYSDDDAQNESTSFTFRYVQEKDEQLVRLEKERDNIASRTQQMECDELAKLLDTVTVLESDIDAANAVFVDRHALVNALQSLEEARNELNSTLLDRAHKLDVLKKQLEWKTQWIKSHQWVLSATRKLWDFCAKKARFDPTLDNIDNSSPPDQRNLSMALHSHQDRISDAGERQMTVLSESYQSMVDGMNDWVRLSKAANNNILETHHNSIDTSPSVYDFTNKQSMVVQEYRALIQLSQYASKLVAQRSSVVDILVHMHDASREGERLRDNLTKSTRRMMEHDLGQRRSNSQSTQQTSRQQQPIQERVDSFQQLTAKIKKNVDSIGYHLFSARIGDTGFSSIFSSAQTQQSQQSEIKNLLVNKMNQLVKLESLLVGLLASYDNAEKKKQLVLQYSADALELDRWIQEQIVALKQRHLDVAAETLEVLLDGKSWDDLNQQHQQFVAKVGSFEADQLKKLHDKVALLMNETLTTEHHASADQPGHLRQQHQRRSVDMTLSVTQNLALTITNFAALKQGITDEAVTMDAVRKRIEWSDVLQKALSQLELIQTRLSDWCKKKDQWIYSDAAFGDDQVDHRSMLLALYEDLEQLTADKDEFMRTTLPRTHELYDTFVQSFANLPRPAATPDHIENAMASLDRSSNRCHEALISRNKELDVIQSCLQWDTDWKGVYMTIENCQAALEHFVSHSARWKPSALDRNNNNTLAKESQTIHQQCALLDQKLKDLSSQFDRLHSEISINNVGNSITKSMSSKLEQAECHSRHVSQLNHFLDLVVKQNEMVHNLLCRMDHIGSDLKSVLEEYKTGYSETHDVYDSATDYSEPSKISMQHKQFANDVGQLRSDASGMIYPVRPVRYGDVSTDDGDDALITLDNAANNKIRGTLTDGLGRLDQNVLELGRIILVHEQRSRCYATLQAFKKQLQACGDFTREQRTKLDKAILTLDTDIPDLNTITNHPPLSFNCYLPTLEQARILTSDVERDLTSYDYMRAGIESLHEQYLDLPHDELVGKVQEEFHGLDLVHTQTMNNWQELGSVAKSITCRIENEILPPLLTHELKQLNQMLDAIDLELRSQHYSSVSEDQLAEWIKKTKTLRQNYNQLRMGICGGFTTLSVAQLDSTSKKISQLEDLLKTTENRMAQWQQIEQHQSQINAFMDKTTAGIQSLVELQSSIDASDFTDTMSNSVSISQQQKDNYRYAMDDVKKLETLYEDLHDITQQSYQTGCDDFQMARQRMQEDQIEETWTKLQDTVALLTQRMNLMNRWLDLYNALNEVQQIVIGCKTTLETIPLHKYSPLSDQNKDTTDIGSSILLDNVEKQLYSVLSRLKNGPGELDQHLLDDKYHHGLYSDSYRETLELTKEVENLLQEHHIAADLARLTRRYQDAIGQRLQLCTNQKSSLARYDQLYQHLNSQYQADGYPQSKNANIHDLLKSHFIDLDNAKGVVLDCKNDLVGAGDINGMYEELSSDFNLSHGELDGLQQPLLSLVKILDDMIAYQEEQHRFIGSVESYESHATELLGTISQLYTRLNSLKTMDSDQYNEVMQQHVTLKESADLFTSFTDSNEDKMLTLAHNHGGGLLQDNCLAWLNRRYLDVMQSWTQCCDLLDAHHRKLLDDEQTQQENSEMEDLVKYVDDMKKRVDTLHLSGRQNIEAEHEELADIEKEFLDTICPRIDTILKKQEQQSSYHKDSSTAIEQLCSSLKQSKVDLKQVIGSKKMDAHQQDKTLALMDDINELEKVIDHVDDLIAAAAPHHSRIVNGSFVKSDLQDLLSGLIKAYKMHSMVVGSLFDNLHGKSEKIAAASTLVDLLESTKRRWVKTKEAAAARERELQTCIEQLQNEFFTKLAIIGKSQHQQQQQQRQSTLSLGSSSPSSSSFSYKVDRENSLDVQIEKVLKNQPYRTKVKMVPGQVGKYWIGDKHPRLVYCRILKSKVVMVRVGGGWVELSQFLLDHGCNDGTIIPGGQQTGGSRFKEAFIRVTSRSLSPSGRVTLRGGGGLKYNGIKGSDSSGSLSPSRSSSKTSTSTRCRSPLAGYTDGDRYVRVDESGNHFALKMTRVDDDYFIPYQHTNKLNYNSI